MLFGDTGRGKTYLIGEYATWLYETKKQRTVVALADRGWKTLTPQIKAGIIIPVPLTKDVFGWLSHVVKGHILVDDKWVPAPDDVGCRAFESASSIGHELNQYIRKSHSGGNLKQGQDGKMKTVGIGPAANTFKVGEGVDEHISASLDKGHFGLMQMEIRDRIWESQDLPGLVIWTALALRKQDDDTKINDIVGPEFVGKALTGAGPSWFHYTLHVDSIITGDKEEHVLYLGGHSDLTTGNARAAGNARNPFGADPIPTVIKPASLVKALEILEGNHEKTTDKFVKKYGIKV